MILAIDVGNTNVVIGCLNGDQVIFTERLTSKRVRTTTEYTMEIRNILQFHGIVNNVFEGAIVSSVVPQVTGALCGAIRRLTGKEPVVVGPGMKTGLNIRIDNPAQLGSDLLVDSVAASKLYEKPVLIIDMGTATTLCIVNEQNQYIGGALFPGISASLDSLLENTSLLHSVSTEAPRKVIGTNTSDCLKSGLIYGHASAIDGLIDRMEAEYGKKFFLVATGGLSHTVIPHCRHRIIINDNLLLIGLRILYEKNTPDPASEGGITGGEA